MMKSPGEVNLKWESKVFLSWTQPGKMALTLKVGELDRGAMKNRCRISDFFIH